MCTLLEKKEKGQNCVVVRAVKVSVIAAKTVNDQTGHRISSCANPSNL